MIFCCCFRVLNPFKEGDLGRRRKKKKRTANLETTVLSDDGIEDNSLNAININRLSDYVSIYKAMGLARTTDKFLNFDENQMAVFKSMSTAEFIQTFERIVPEESDCIIC